MGDVLPFERKTPAKIIELRPSESDATDKPHAPQTQAEMTPIRIAGKAMGKAMLQAGQSSGEARQLLGGEWEVAELSDLPDGKA